MTKITKLTPKGDTTDKKRLAQFGTVFSVLAVQLRFDHDEVIMRSYYKALGDLPLDALEASAHQFAIETGRKFFPTTAEWATAARIWRLEQQQAALHAEREQPWRIECEACQDVGWVTHQCPGDSTCGRFTQHYAHDYVTRCPCRPTNRTYQRHHQAGGDWE